jgi:hypothetical protein
MLHQSFLSVRPTAVCFRFGEEKGAHRQYDCNKETKPKYNDSLKKI